MGNSASLGDSAGLSGVILGPLIKLLAFSLSGNVPRSSRKNFASCLNHPSLRILPYSRLGWASRAPVLRLLIKGLFRHGILPCCINQILALETKSSLLENFYLGRDSGFRLHNATSCFPKLVDSDLSHPTCLTSVQHINLGLSLILSVFVSHKLYNTSAHCLTNTRSILVCLCNNTICLTCALYMQSFVYISNVRRPFFVRRSPRRYWQFQRVHV